ncbi:SDR family oxidoreductase [Streptacidiphilus monticola]
MATEAILVTGATGVLGRHVLERVRATGRPARALTRRTALPDDPAVTWFTGDLAAGTGLDAAFAGVGTVIHCAGDARHYKNDLPAFRHLLEAAERAGVGHVVNISIVGIDRIPCPTTGSSWRANGCWPPPERAGATCARRSSSLLDAVFSALAKFPVLPMLSKTPCQPVDPGEVADRLVELALGDPVGHAPDVAGPDILPLTALAQQWLQAAGRHRPVLPVRVPGRLGAALRAGHLTAPERAVGTRTWQQFLATKKTNSVPGRAD